MKKNHLLRCRVCLSLLNWIGAPTLSLFLKAPPRKLVFDSFCEVALSLYKSTIWACMEYSCNVWVGSPGYHLEMLDKLQKRICRTVCPTLAVSLETLTHCRNKASLNLIYRNYFGIWKGWTCSTSLFWEVYSLFLQIAWFFCQRS